MEDAGPYTSAAVANYNNNCTSINNQVSSNGSKIISCSSVAACIARHVLLKCM